MKKITYIISVIALLFAAVSCDKINRGLTELPIDDINPDAYFRTESECQLWLNRCYYNYIVSPASVANRWGDDCINTNPFGIVEGTRLVVDKNDGETAWVSAPSVELIFSSSIPRIARMRLSVLNTRDSPVSSAQWDTLKRLDVSATFPGMTT